MWTGDVLRAKFEVVQARERSRGEGRTVRPNAEPVLAVSQNLRTMSAVQSCIE